MELFKDELAKLTDTEKMLVKHINEDLEFYSTNSIEKCSNRSNVSTALFSRLHKKLNFESFKQMQFFIRHKYLNEINLSKWDSDLAYKVAFYYINAIQNTANTLDRKKIDEAVTKIAKMRKVILFGIGSSLIACREFALSLQKLAITPLYDPDFHTFLLSIGYYISKPEKPLVILVSKSGKTKEFRYLLDLLEANQFDYLIITANRALAGKYKNVLLHHTLEQKNRINALSSKVVQQYILDLLLFKIINILNISEIKENQTKVIDDWNNS
ncbi:putative HTH-type transcriptional regulator [Mycoplasmopsis californica]|uniref:MurR/RpiR family transcriptional regulator n=1 Tax=Mycoplasmopsis equigenitalium TaxID=114883 RepID=A0ABY5J231_9BACT|nr:MurR/RpiR family transcriptional regulator [Mycoplasmopsis equigenitalium]UUD36828.1 MurR/RpiR family transcriptional regulator [Mycoplasmopsis equigenitalium]VEU69875.1 putative HTH-type transcriptional regulator [Mycoplasmopsis californica]